MEAMLKIGDTIADIEEGLNAGMWTIGVAKTGNGLGMSESEVQKLDAETLTYRLRQVYETMCRAGAHFVVDGIGAVPPLIEEINKLLALGVKP